MSAFADLTPTNYAHHIRGRVRQISPSYVRRTRTSRSAWTWRITRPLLVWEVINTRTGVVLASDNSCVSLAQAMTNCARMVEIARLSTFWGYSRKALR